MKKFLLILGGVIVIAAAVAGIIMWWWDELYVVFKGGLGLMVIMAGIILIAVGAGETSETPEVKTEEQKKEEPKA